ncbi:Endonuclease/exonuclease/phosphatase [Rhodothermus marinus SG0.5JP17-172]|uniref:endonuclease/exonuclease/phosphatase family protein n=1 Tax=Rhodothermus marinus TaxID=29549 RepID=UPI000223D1E1|nr:endonuclease/exonuclease/phosphatase family protein [Rhodothermus marinus]AEN72178.1 Endonuclease/exonuclease/phosphatase [Rhodothermus marinus SG0.5JP17-172]
MLRRLTPLLVIAFLLVPACRQTEPEPEIVEYPREGLFVPEPPPEYRAEGIRIATLNTFFLFDGYGDEGQADFPHKGNPEAARRHRARIAQVLRMIDADLVVLQEVENEEVLRRMVTEDLPDLNYEVHFVQGHDTFTGQDVAVLSRLPVEKIGRTEERVPVEGTDDTYGVSKNIWVRLYLGDLPATIIGVHFLAQPDDSRRKPRREAQAEVIRRLVERELAAGRAVAVLGDFNDYDESVLDLNGHRPITRTLALVKAAGPGPDDDLYNVMAEVPQHDRFTVFYDADEDWQVEWPELAAIDHVLLSPRLRARLREVHYVQAYDPRTVTDHFPIVVILAPR